MKIIIQYINFENNADNNGYILMNQKILNIDYNSSENKISKSVNKFIRRY